jgi:hypothetical protein
MKAKTKSFQMCSVVEDNFGKNPTLQMKSQDKKMKG